MFNSFEASPPSPLPYRAPVMLVLDSGDFLLHLGSFFWSWFTSTSLQTSFPPRTASVPFCSYLSIKLGWFRYNSFLGEKSWTIKLLHRERFTSSVEILYLTQFFMHLWIRSWKKPQSSPRTLLCRLRPANWRIGCSNAGPPGQDVRQVSLANQPSSFSFLLLSNWLGRLDSKRPD